ncbi:GntR family transcriptional regulator/MocR family aminotransferase [Actinocorallia herbida]|uniref:GntR family transcriptional regulator/MocR family aminotransferase n=1 Tax=Actinocorallia herbida TaxID=58109 RepID=A0A3N1CRM7_9ACTN|nr:PLP-dependent aminotransferase family protein [Actinocorallia herbida]ROO83348.1 GntR family transcriptional regulator/MocR family aminotransferase [Actinocorallia herbida]
MARTHADLPVLLDRTSGDPLHVQLAETLRARIRAGDLPAGERLPSSRAFAAALGVSRTVVTESYQQLYAEGWLEGRHGSGTYVADVGDPRPPGPVAGPAVAGEPAELSRDEARALGLVDLRPGGPWTGGHAAAAWKRAWRAAAEHPPGDDPDPRGLPRLRALLCDHLRRARGVAAGPENLIVTRGTGNGLDLVGALFAAGRRAGVEDPGYGSARSILAARGAVPVACPVDRDGIVVDGLPDDLALLYTTPAHQYPLGGRLPIARRERLLEWARRTGARVVEDDYDAEFRYDVAPLPALYGLDPSQVILLGTLSKTLSPDPGLGWIVAAPETADRIAALRRDLADRTSVPVQHAMAELLDRGDLDRHLRRMRLEYARRRALVVDILGDRVTGDTAGLHVMLPLPEDRLEPVRRAARAHGVLLDDTRRYTRAPHSHHGLVLGYATPSTADLRRACTTLAALL